MNVDWATLGRALALVMVIEGLMPFAMPSTWRRTLFSIAQMENRSLRLIGALSMGAGLIVLQLL